MYRSKLAGGHDCGLGSIGKSIDRRLESAKPCWVERIVVNSDQFRGCPGRRSAPSGLAADERLAYKWLSFVYAKVAYVYQTGLRSQTLYDTGDSPVTRTWYLAIPPKGIDKKASISGCAVLFHSGSLYKGEGACLRAGNLDYQ
jgi:hypothetical protein